MERLLRACGAELDVLLPSAEPAVPPEQWTTVQGILAQTPTERVEQMLAWGRLVTELRAAGARLRG